MRTVGWVAGRALPFVFGWYLAMSYPLVDDMPAKLLSLAIGTIGVGLVGVWAYACGFWDAMPPKDKRPFGRSYQFSTEQGGEG